MEPLTITAIAVGSFLTASLLSTWLYTKPWNRISFFIKKWSLIMFILCANAAAMFLVYWFNSSKVIFALLVALKSKDYICSLIQYIYRPYQLLFTGRLVDYGAKKIACVVPMYNETLEEVKRTALSIVNATGTMQKVLCIVSDGGSTQASDILSRRDDSYRRTYRGWKGGNVDVDITFGLIETTPAVIIQKGQNVGKKDSILLCHGIFNEAEFAPEVRSLVRSVLQIERFNFFIFH